MATFRVTDPDTGVTLRLEGEAPPTEAELEEIFRQTPKPGPLPLRQPSPPPISTTSERPAQPSFFAPPARATEQELVAEIVRPPTPPIEQRREALGRERNQLFREIREDTPSKVLTRAGLAIGQAGGALRRIEGGLIGALPDQALLPVGIASIKLIMEPLTGESKQQASRRIRDEGRKLEERYRQMGIDMGGGSLSDITQELASTGLVSSPTIPAAMFGGLPAAATLAGLQSVGGTYDEAVENYKRRGLKQTDAEDRALLPAYLSGVITGGVTAAFGRTGVEALANRQFTANSVSQIVKNLLTQVARPRGAFPEAAGVGAAEAVPKRVGDLMVDVVRQSGLEGLEEMADEIGQNIVAKATYDPDRTLGQAVETSIFAGLAGSMLGGSATIAVRAPELGARRFGRGRRLLSLQEYRGSGRRRTQLSRLRTQREINREMEDITQSILQVGRTPDADRIQGPVAQIPSQTEAAEGVQAVPTGAPGQLPISPGTTPPKETTKAPPVPEVDPEIYPIQDVNVADITFDPQVRQFKAGADPATGVVPGQEIKAKRYERLANAPIVVWQRTNGTLRIATGRHRLDLAKRLKVKSIPAQIIREDQGWTAERVRRLDAESNIRDDKGDATDYARYFYRSGITPDQAAERGLLSYEKGQIGFNVATYGIADLYSRFLKGDINGQAANIIAETAPLEPRIQGIGIRRALAGDRPGAIKARLQIERARKELPFEEQRDLFGGVFDESNSQRQADEVDMIRRELRDQINAVRGAANNPQAAAKLGVDVRDPEGVRNRIATLQDELNQWEGNWWLNRALVAKLAERTTQRKPSEKEKGQKEEEGRARVLTPPPAQPAPAPAAPTAPPAAPAAPPAAPAPAPAAPAAAPTIPSSTPEELADLYRQFSAEWNKIQPPGPTPLGAGITPPEIPTRLLEIGLRIVRYHVYHPTQAVRSFQNFARKVYDSGGKQLWEQIKNLLLSFWYAEASRNANLEDVTPAEARQIISQIEQAQGAAAAAASKPFDDEVNQWADWRVNIRGVDVNVNPTKNTLLRTVRKAGQFFAQLGRKSWDEVTVDDILAWRITLNPEERKAAGEKVLAQSTADKYREHLEIFFEERPLWRQKPNPVDLRAAFIKRRLRQEKQIGGKNEYIAQNDLEKLLAPSDANDVTGLQTDALLELYYASGLRNEDVARLKLNQLDLDNGWLRGVLIEKQDLRGDIPIPDSAVEALRRYMAVRNRLDYPNNDWLFPGDNRSHMSTGTTLARLQTRAKNRGVKLVNGKRPRIHDLRRSIMQHLQDELGFTEDDTRKIIPHAAQSVEQASYLSRPANWEEKFGRAPGRLLHNRLFLERRQQQPAPAPPPMQLPGTAPQQPPAPPREGAPPDRQAQILETLGGEQGNERDTAEAQRVLGNWRVGEPNAISELNPQLADEIDGELFLETIDAAGAKDMEGLRRLLNSDRVRIPPRTKRILEALINSNLHRRLPAVSWAIADYIRGGIRGEYYPQGRLIRFLNSTDASIPIHEFFHHLWYYLKQEDRDFIREMRLREVDKAGVDLQQTMTSDEAVRQGIGDEFYHLINEREFFVWMMTQKAMAQFERPAERGFVERMREWISRLWNEIKNTVAGTPETRVESIWQQLITGRYDYLPEQAKEWEQTNREGAPPAEPNYFQAEDEAAAKIQYASMELPRLVRDKVNDRQAAAGRLEQLAYNTNRFRAARQKVDELVTAAQREAQNSNDPYWEIPGNMPTKDDEELAEKLTALGIEFDPTALRAMQADIKFENESVSQWRRMMRLREVQSQIATLAKIGMQPEQYDELTQTENRLRIAINRVNNDDDRSNSLGITIGERAEQIDQSERTRDDDAAKAASLQLEFVKDFLGQLKSGDRLSGRFGNTLQLFKGALDDPNLPDHYKRAIANEAIKRIFEFEDLAGEFQRFYERQRANIAKSIRQQERNLTEAKIKRGLGEILLLDALATAEGEKGLTGTWATREAVEYLIDSYGAIMAFANNLRTKYPNGGAQALLLRLLGGLASPDASKFDQKSGWGGSVAKVLDAIKSETIPELAEVKRAAGVSDEALARILFVLGKSRPFADAINTILQYGEMKISREPAIRLRRIAELLEKGDQFSKAEARGMIEQIVTEAQDAKDENGAAMRSIARELRRENIALKALDYGKEIFEGVTGTAENPNPEYADIRRRAEDKLAQEERMILDTGGKGDVLGQTTRFFKPFKVKNQDVEIDQAQEDVSARDSVLLDEGNFKRIQRWFENAEKYIAAFEFAEAEWRADPTNFRSPEELGFDRRTYLGLMRAIDEHYQAFQEATVLQQGGLLANNRLEQWKLGLRWFRQFLRGIKQARGPVARDAQHEAVRYGNNLLAMRSASQSNRLPVLKAQREALKSHPEFRGDLERYKIEVFNEMGSEGRKFGSPLRPGLALPTYGNRVTAEDIAYLQAQRRYNDDIRRQVTEREGRGIIEERGRERDYRVFVRQAASVGDYGLPMHIENRGAELVLGLMDGYSKGKDAPPTAASDLTPAGNSNPIVNFWNNNPESLIRHILDAGRAARNVDQTDLMRDAERAAAARLLDKNNPRLIRSLDDAVALIAENFPANSGLDVRNYVATQLLAELSQYYRNAQSMQAKQGELEKSEGVGGISLASEFTQRAATYQYPSNWYDYGAVTDAEMMMQTARAMHEPIMGFARAMERLHAQIQKELDNDLSGAAGVKNYKDHWEATRVAKIIQDLIGDLKGVWDLGNPDNQRWAVEFPPDIVKASLLANLPVSIRNVVTGAGMAVIRMQAMNRFSNSLALLQSLKYIHKIIGRVPLDLLFSQQSRLGRQTYRFLKGPGRKLVPAFVSDFAERLVDGHLAKISELRRLGFSIRQPFFENLADIWGRTGIYQSSEQARRERSPLGTAGRVTRNVFRTIGTAFQQVGPDYFDKIINAEALAWSNGIERTLRKVAEVYGSNRTELGKYDPSNADWIIKPEEFSKRMSMLGKQKNLAEFRDFLNSADISLEKTLNDYYQRLQSNRERGIEEPPRMFTDEQLAALRRAVIRDFNAADALNRPTAMQRSRLFRAIAAFQGWVTDFLLKLTASVNGTRDQKGWEKLANSIPTILGLGVALSIYGLYSQGMTDWYRRRFQGATQRMVTIFNKEFWNDWRNAKDSTLTALLSQLGYYGDLALFTKGVVVNNRGYDPAGRVLALGLMQDAFNTLRGMWNLRNDGWNVLNPMRDFLTKYTAGAREVMTAANPDHKAVRQYRGANSVISYFAEQEGLMTERTAGNVKPGIFYSATSGIREDITAAMMQQDSGDLQAAYDRLIDYYRQKGVEDPEQHARRDFMMTHPAIRGFAGKRPSSDEWNRVYGRMTGEQRAVVDNAVNSWDWASRQLGINYEPLANRGGTVNLAGASMAGLGAGAGATAFRAGFQQGFSRRARAGGRRIRRGRIRRVRGRTRRLRLRGRRRTRLRVARLRTPRLPRRRLRLPRPRLTTV